MAKYSFNGNKMKTSTVAHVFVDHRNENKKEVTLILKKS
jgi:hypothetical protein